MTDELDTEQKAAEWLHNQNYNDVQIVNILTAPENKNSYNTIARQARGLVEYCDELCKAKNKPVTLEDYKLAYDHWRYHDSWLGCSHGR